MAGVEEVASQAVGRLSRVYVEELGSGQLSTWDAFAQRCDTSYRGLNSWLQVWQAQNHFPFRLRQFSLFRDRERLRKIGQCAAGVGLQGGVFIESLHLLPAFRDAWRASMVSILERIGPGQYSYGSDWSLEAPREGELDGIPGISIGRVQRYLVEGVAFARWNSWDDYERSMSANVRRNLKRAAALHGPSHVEVKRGRAAIGLLPDLLKCKAAMYRRKTNRNAGWRIIAGQTLRVALIPNEAFCAVLRNRSGTLASMGGVEMGRIAYYFDGGSMNADGSGWLLLMQQMRRFYMRRPQGLYLMGSAAAEEEPGPDWESSARYRRDCRVSGFPTSVVQFTYR